MSGAARRVLVVDDEPDLRTLYELTLVREGHDVECAGSVQEALAALGRGSFHLLITDMRLPDGQGIALLHHLERTGRPERAIVITAFGSAENAVSALKAGAFDYLTKPVDLRQFRTVVASALGRVAAPARSAAPTAPVTVDSGASSPARPEMARMVGGSSAMVQVRALVDKVSRSMAPVLVTGESGTGKELVARAIQERSVRPVGATAEIPCNARIISATHRDLAADVQAGRFRQDLYFRLNVIHIPVPPLRERLDDLAPLCADILSRIAAEAGVHPPPSVTQQALAHLASFAFPGNVRQLENMLHRALALSGAETIGTEELGGDQALALDSAAAPGEAAIRVSSDLQGAVGTPQAVRPSAEGVTVFPATGALPTDIAAYLDSVERSILEQALSRHRFNRTAAGASLGLSLRQMRYRMARLGIGAETDAPEQP